MEIAQLQKMLDEYVAFDDREEGFLAKTRDFLSRHNADTAFNRKTAEGHITASSFILNKDMTKTLMLHHKTLKQWFQLGGHVESEDTDFIASVLREAKEETGIDGIRTYSDDIFDIDVHAIPEHKGKQEPRHIHYDIRMLLIAPTEVTVAEDGAELRWCTPDEAIGLQAEEMYRMVAKWKALAGSKAV